MFFISFKSIVSKELKKFNWNAHYSVKLIIKDIVVVDFPKCAIELFHNDRYGIVECEFYNPLDKESEKYSLNEVLRFNDINVPKDDLFNLTPSKEKMQKYLQKTFFTINSELSFVISGDFSWASKIDEFKENTRLIQSALNTVFIEGHPIYKKLVSGDLTWRDDLKLLKR